MVTRVARTSHIICGAQCKGKCKAPCSKIRKKAFFRSLMISCSAHHAVYCSLVNVMFPWVWGPARGAVGALPYDLACTANPALFVPAPRPLSRMRRGRGTGSLEPILGRGRGRLGEAGLCMSEASKSPVYAPCSIRLHFQNKLKNKMIKNFKVATTEH